MLRVYVAGKYSGSDVISILKNIKDGISFSAKVMKCGFSVYVPWLDHQLAFFEDFDVQTYKDVSMSWLEVSDAVILVPDQERSQGVLDEIQRAKELNIPVFESLDDLIGWARLVRDSR